MVSQIGQQQKKSHKMEKLDSLKIKNFCASRNTIRRVKKKIQNVRKVLQILYLT